MDTICGDIQGIRVPRSKGKVRYEAICIPPAHEGDWALDHIMQDTETRERFARVLSHLGIIRAYAPYVGAMSARVYEPDFFHVSTELGNGVTVFNNPDEPADGVLLPRVHDAMIMRAAGCALLAVAGDGKCAGAHAGRESYFDRQDVETGTPSREPNQRTIVYSLADALFHSGAHLGHLSLTGFFGIRTRAFRNPFNDETRRIYHQNLRPYAIAQGWGDRAVLVDEEAAYPNFEELTKSQGRLCRFGSVGYEKELRVDGLCAYTRHPTEWLRRAGNCVILHRLS